MYVSKNCLNLLHWKDWSDHCVLTYCNKNVMDKTVLS